ADVRRAGLHLQAEVALAVRPDERSRRHRQHGAEGDVTAVGEGQLGRRGRHELTQRDQLGLRRQPFERLADEDVAHLRLAVRRLLGTLLARALAHCCLLWLGFRRYRRVTLATCSTPAIPRSSKTRTRRSPRSVRRATSISTTGWASPSRCRTPRRRRSCAIAGWAGSGRTPSRSNGSPRSTCCTA